MEGPRERFKLKCRCLQKGITGPRSGKLRKMTELKGTTVFQIKTLWIPSSATWSAVRVKSSVLCIMCSTAVRRCQMCVYCVLWTDSANETRHMLAFLYLQLATALRGPGLAGHLLGSLQVGPSCCVL